jgi:glutamate/aspartate transport system substrate-binding protein
VTSSGRIPLLANGTIDLECGSTTNNPDRLKQVAFTNTHFLTATRFISKKSSHLNSIDDLKGKTVASTSGTTNIKQLTEANAARNLGINIVPAKEHAESFLMVETDRAVAAVLDDILLASFAAGAKDPGAYVISSDAFSKPEPYGIMLRKDDPAFNKVADDATALSERGRSKALCEMVPAENPAEGLEPQCADGGRVEEGICQAYGFARSGFLQGHVRGRS